MKKIDIACIIDDDPIFVYGIKRMMKLANFCESFIICNNGEDAITKLTQLKQTNQQIPDVILLDLNMPIMDGWQFLDEFKKLNFPKKTTVYIVSSSIDPRDKNRVKQYENVSNFIVKPITKESLTNITKELIISY